MQEVFRLFDDFAVFVFAAALDGVHEGVDVFACFAHGVDGGEVGDVCPPRRAVVFLPFAGEVFG